VVGIGRKRKSEVTRRHTSYFALTFQTPNVIARIPIAATAVLVAQFDGRTHQPPSAIQHISIKQMVMEGEVDEPAGDQTYFG